MPTAEPSPLAEAVARVGDRWSLLIVQALLSGTRGFTELLDELSGIAPNVLSQRLKHLEREALVVSRPYSRRPPRFAYELSACSPSGARSGAAAGKRCATRSAAPRSRPAGTARPAPAPSKTTKRATS